MQSKASLSVDQAAATVVAVASASVAARSAYVSFNYFRLRHLVLAAPLAAVAAVAALAAAVEAVAATAAGVAMHSQKIKYVVITIISPQTHTREEDER